MEGNRDRKMKLKELQEKREFDRELEEEHSQLNREHKKQQQIESKSNKFNHFFSCLISNPQLYYLSDTICRCLESIKIV